MAYSEVARITLTLAQAIPALPAGSITDVLYFDEASWRSLVTGPAPTIDVGSVLQLAVVWRNDDIMACRGMVEVNVTEPDFAVAPLSASSGQGTSVAPGASGQVQFNPLAITKEGAYAGEIVLLLERV